jgi:hypothetical protein
MSAALAERIYRFLLRAYPPAFRAEYGREMVLLFRDQCREGDSRTLGFWAAVISDVVRSAPALRVEAWSSRATQNNRTTGVIMKLTAMLTVLLGVMSVLNTGVELGAAATQTIQGAHAVSLALAVLAGVLLLAAGVAMLSPMPRGRQAARVAVLASLVCIVAARALFPWMSILSQLVGIGLPVVLLIALYWPRRPTTATNARSA